MTREELREHCERQIQQFEQVEKLMPVTLNDWKRYEEHKLILELLEQEPKMGHWEYGYAFADGNYCKCSECKEIIKCIYPMHYCPNCGAKMVEPKKSEDITKGFEEFTKMMFRQGQAESEE